MAVLSRCWFCQSKRKNPVVNSITTHNFVKSANLSPRIMRFWVDFSCTLAVIVVILIRQCISFRVVRDSEFRKRDNTKYFTRTGYEKVKNYLQRRFMLLHHNGTSDDKHSYYTNTWAVHVFPPHKQVADRIADKHGFINIGPVSESIVK